MSFLHERAYDQKKRDLEKEKKKGFRTIRYWDRRGDSPEDVRINDNSFRLTHALVQWIEKVLR